MEVRGNSLIFDNVSKWYGEVLGVMDVTTTIQSGVLGILGPNGAGKSTFLKLATGQLKPDKGHITAFGMPVYNNVKYNEIMGYCPEFENMYDFMTGREFVEFMLRLNGYGREEGGRLAFRAIKTVNMEEDCSRKIGTYSKGMRQRIKIAQAIAHRPKVIFLDEPLAGTDPIGRAEIIQLIRKMGEEGMTVIVSSHILHEVEKMTDRVLMLYKGRNIAWGKLDEIRNQLDRYPLTVHIHGREERKLASVLANMETVSSIKIGGGGVDIKVLDPNKFHSELPGVLVKEKLSISGIKALDDDLESIFTYLTTEGGVL